MPKTLYFTICAANYLAYARTLAGYLREAEPGAEFVVFLADRATPELRAAVGDLRIVPVDEIGVPDLRAMAFRYDVMEFSTAIKPFCFDYAFDRLACDFAVYFDPDIAVLRPLEHVHAALARGAPCVLTPHVLAPLDDGRQPDTLTFLRCGVFNLGFAAFANAPPARRFIGWWGEYLRTRSFVDFAQGMFTDQRFCDFAPAFLPDAAVLRHPGYNAAYWNLPQRAVSREGETYLVNGEPLHFFHFSGLNPSRPEIFSKHQNRYTRARLGDLRTLYDDYVARLAANDRSEIGSLGDVPYAFNFFADGRPAPEPCRWAFHRYSEAAEADPFELAEDFFTAPATDLPSFPEVRISRLYAALWHRLDGLRRIFDLATPTGQAVFVPWASTVLALDYGVAQRLLEPDRQGPRVETSTDLVDRLTRAERAHNILMGALTSRSSAWKNVLRLHLRGKDDVRARWRNTIAAVTGPHAAVAMGAAGLGAPELAPGLAIYGHFDSEAGTGEAARELARAFATTGRAMSCHTIAGGNLKEVIPFAAREDALPRFDRILTCLNADTTAQIDAFVPRAARAGRHRFGMWVWELPVFPAIWAGALAEVDEIWAPSRFVADAVAGATAKPVRVVPYPVAPEAAETRTARLALGLAQDAFIFLTAFDFNSFTARKNPQAAILAFRDAFPDAGDRSVRLIVKCHGTQGREVHSRLIADLIARDPRIQLIDEVYPSARMNLLQAACDAFVSLHRSEGFGLNIARCMAHGKPVVATDFGGNTDFMTTENAVPIEYRMRAVARDEYPGGAGQWWADPLHEAAVEAMRRLRERPALQAELGARARRDVRSAFSHEAVGRTMLRYWSAASASGAKGMPGAHHRLFTNAP